MVLKTSLCLMLCVVSILGSPQEYPPPELKEFIEPLHDTCTAKMGVSNDEIKSYQFSDKSKKMMCYMKCLLEEAKWIKSGEVIDYAFIEENAHPSIKDIVLKAIDKCRDIPGGEDCEKSYNLNVCLSKADPEHYFLP